MYSITTEALDTALKAQLTALYAAKKLSRGFSPKNDLRLVDGAEVTVPVSDLALALGVPLEGEAHSVRC